MTTPVPPQGLVWWPSHKDNQPAVPLFSTAPCTLHQALPHIGDALPAAAQGTGMFTSSAHEQAFVSPGNTQPGPVLLRFRMRRTLHPFEGVRPAPLLRMRAAPATLSLPSLDSTWSKSHMPREKVSVLIELCLTPQALLECIAFAHSRRRPLRFFWFRRLRPPGFWSLHTSPRSATCSGCCCKF